MLRSLRSALVVGMGRHLMQRAPLKGPSFRVILVVMVLLGAHLLAVFKFPVDRCTEVLQAAEIILRLHVDTLARV